MDGKSDRKQYMTNMQRLLEKSSLLNKNKIILNFIVQSKVLSY